MKSSSVLVMKSLIIPFPSQTFVDLSLACFRKLIKELNVSGRFVRSQFLPAELLIASTVHPAFVTVPDADEGFGFQKAVAVF
jgi:hypothetical protein